MILIAIMWTFCLCVDLVAMFMGNEPSWILVFCPLTMLVFNCWTEYFEKRGK